MKTAEKDKLKHDFLNSIVIINCMTKSASNFLNKLSKCMDEKDINQKQMEKFLYSMNTIREQTARLENYFQSLVNE
jgi:GTP cyclohydrolase FolE2